MDHPQTFFDGGGEMGALMRAHDWSTSPLGDPAGWPQSLRTTVSLMLNSRYPMFIAWGPKLAFLYNDGYRPIFGAKHPHTLGLPFAEVWSEIWEDIRPLVERALDGKPTFNENLHLVMGRNGYPEDTWYTFSYSPVRDESGGVGGMFCACQETTAQVLADRRRDFRIELEDRLRTLRDPLAVMAIAAETVGRYMKVGRCGYAEFDASAAFLTVERDWTDGVMPSLAGRHRLSDFGGVGEELRAGRPVRLDDQIADERTQAVAQAYEQIGGLRAGIGIPLLKDGRLVSVFYVHQTSPRRWTDEDEGLVREVAERTWAAVGAARAEAALRESEAALRQLTVELEQRVVERTRQHEEALAKVHELQKMETIGQLTGGVAHDFNNLLAPIVGALEMVRRRQSGDERSERLIAGALQSAERARTLISRLLTFAGRQHLEPSAVDVAELIAGMEDLVTRSIGPQIEVSFELAPDLPAARVDPGQLELAILNLAVNARDAMPEGGDLGIAVDEADASEIAARALAGRYIRLRISDTGRGMDAETLKRAIEPFYSTKGVGKGTGLGLSMVHGLAAQSGGALALTSSPGKGTVATLLLPVAHEAAQKHAKPGDGPVRQTSPQRILLVDDEELVRMATTEMLRSMGHKVRQASSGAQALEILERDTDIDLVVSDYLMPGMMGGAFIRRAREVRPDIPALLITGYTNLATDIGPGVPQLAKPFRHNELAAALADLVSGAVAPFKIQPDHHRSGSARPAD